MPTRLLRFEGFLLPTLLTVLIVLSVLSLANTVRRIALGGGGVDLHPYWYYGHFIRYGMNPYFAYTHKISLSDPVRYLDGSEVPADKVAQEYKANIPANLASTLLLTSLFSFLSWNHVLYVWFIINLALLIAIPWLTVRLLPPALMMTSRLQWLVVFGFYAIKGTRTALLLSQPSVLVFFLMIVTLLLRQSHWLWAGLALGMALGKYSLSLPIVIFLVLEKRFRVIFVAVLVQVTSLLVVSMLDGGSIWETVQTYWQMLTLYTAKEPGMHFGYALAEYPQLARLLVVVGTGITGAMLVYCFRRGLQAADVLPVNSLLCLWTILATYHRNYDSMVAIFFMVFCLSAITTWQLPTRQTQLLSIFWIIAFFILWLPGEMAENFLPEQQAMLLNFWIEKSLTIVLVAMWGINLWLLPRVPRVDN